jgi:hypothetical protein
MPGVPITAPPCVLRLPTLKSEKSTQGRSMESTNALTREPGQDFDPSLVHTLETTARTNLPTDYRDMKTSNQGPELSAALDLYSRWDLAHGSEKSELLLQCRHFAWFTRHEETGQVKVVANSCHLRWCPICSEAKRVQIKTAISSWIKTVKKPKFMTFTVKHSTEPLADQIRRLYKAYRLFRQHKFLRKKQRGGVWFFQIKRSSKSGEWHPHLHVIADMDYINKVDIQDDWFLTTGDSYVVDIRAIKDPGKVVDYVSRYAAKPCRLTDFEQTDQDTVADTLNGKRLCGRFGSGSKCKFKNERPVDFIKWRRIISWFDCVVNRYADTPLQAVIKAWVQGIPLKAETADAINAVYGQYEPLNLQPQKPREDKQMFFEGIT